MKKDTVFTVRFDSNTAKRIEEFAKQDERTTAWMIRKLVDEALEMRDKKAKENNS